MIKKRSQKVPSVELNMAGSMFEEKSTQISIAIKNNDVQGLRDALERCEDPHCTDRKGNTYLHYVCTMHRPCIFHILVTAGINVNAQNRHGNTALHVTALQNDCSHVGDLLAAGIDPTIRNKMGKTALEIETKNKFWKTVHDKYQPSIFQAVEEHDVEQVLYLLHCWTRVDCHRGGQSLRQFAASRKFHDIVFHIDKHQHTMSGIYAILEGDTEKASQYLLHSKCNVNLLNYASETSHILQHAMKAKDACQVRMICRGKANLNIRVTLDCYLKAPLFFSAFHPDVPTGIMWTLLRHGPDFTLKDERGRNAAIYALDKTDRKVSCEVIAFMMARGLDMSQRDATGVTLRDVARFARRRDITDLVDKAYVKVIRSSNISELKRLCIMGYDGMFINFNHRDTFIYASGNETEEALNFLQKLPQIRIQVRKFHRGIRQWSRDKIFQFLSSAEWPDILLNARDKGGRTALHLAILHWRMDLLKLFLSWENIDTSAVTNVGRSAYHYACCVEEETERVQFCRILDEAGQDQTLPDYKGLRPEDLIGKGESTEWIQKERKMHYGMEKQLQYVDKYEELCHMMKYKGKTLKHFEKSISRFRYPLAQFHKILSPLMPEYRDLIFVAMDTKKEDIATRLIQLGTDWTLQDWVNADGEAPRKPTTGNSDKKRNQQESQQEGVKNYMNLAISGRVEEPEVGEKKAQTKPSDAVVSGQTGIISSAVHLQDWREETSVEDFSENEKLELVTVEERAGRLGLLRVLSAIERKKIFEEQKQRAASESRDFDDGGCGFPKVTETKDWEEGKISHLSPIRKMSGLTEAENRHEQGGRDQEDPASKTGSDDVLFTEESLEYDSNAEDEFEDESDCTWTGDKNNDDNVDVDVDNDNDQDNDYSDDEFCSDDNSISQFDDWTD